jgi:hypothetical protein
MDRWYAYIYRVCTVQLKNLHETTIFLGNKQIKFTFSGYFFLCQTQSKVMLYTHPFDDRILQSSLLYIYLPNRGKVW